MKPKTLILMIVAVGCGLAASYMTSRVIAERGNQSDVEKVSVLVARKNLAMGILIADPEKLFEEKQFTKGEEPKKAIRELEDLKGRRLNKPLTAEQFVTADDLIDKDRDGLAALMPKGMRAVALNVNAASIVGGFVLPHSHVDILSVITGKDGESSAKIILQNILVLAVDQNSNRPDDRSAIVASTVTVQVTPEQAERLALAQKMGTLSLSLRSFGDDDKISTVGATPQGILKGDKGADDQLVENDVVSPRTRLPAWASKVPEVPAATSDAPAEPKPAEAPPPRVVHKMTIYNGKIPTQAIFTIGETPELTSTRIEKSELDGDPAPKPPAPPAAPDKP
ncbi:MAG TPA: Flp pilus assembly protein CpaB [Gemmataceae bacterium]|nr:Flp pilus assembly protein CpaB [Gemmataceae bacterium]